MKCAICPKFKDEASFTTWYGRQIKDIGGFWFKIPDDSMWAKPYDAVACFWGVTYNIEIKVGDEKKKVDVYKKLRPQQAYSLRCVAQNWGAALVLYYSKVYNKFWEITFHEDTKELIIDLKT